MHPQELSAGDHLHSSVVDEKWSMAGPILSEVDNDFLGFIHIKNEVVDSAPAYQLPSGSTSSL